MSEAMKALADRLEAHVEQMANTSWGLTMQEWNVISNDILEAARTLRSALSPASVRNGGVKEAGAEWLIVKRDLYYMPEAKGYTGIRDKAGRFTREAADQYAAFECTIVHESEAPEFTKACYDDLKVDHLQAKINVLAAELAAERAKGERLREALKFYADPASHIGHRDPSASVYIETSAIDTDGGQRACAALGQEGGG